MNKKMKHNLGLSMIVSALTITVSFFVLCVKKKNIFAAILTLAAAESLAGYALLTDVRIPKPTCLMKKPETDSTELFNEEDLDSIASKVNTELSHKNDGEGTDAPAPRSIPKDEDASESDFT